MVQLHIYELKEVKEFDSIEEAEDEKEYLERVQEKICTIYED